MCRHGLTDVHLLRFLLRFVSRSTARQWSRSVRALIPLDRLALESFDLLGQGGAEGVARAAQPLLAALRTSEQRSGQCDPDFL